MRVVRALVLIGFLLSGCGGAKDAYNLLGDLQQLHADLTTKYNEEISVRINNGTYLYIGLINSKLKELPVEQKKEKAKEIAVYAIARYKDAKKLDVVSVGYVIHKSYVIFNYTEATEQYQFNVRELKSTDSRGAI